MIPATSQIGISIATKDRWGDLKITLERLRNEGLDFLETVVVDDGSTEPMPIRFKEQFPWVKFHRFDVSQGISIQRNRVVELLSTPIVLQLDDDSSPVAGDLAEAAQWLTDHPKVSSLAFRIVFNDDPPNPNTVAPPPYPVISYVGCAALIRRDLFLKLGGYESRFEQSAEETEYCIRAFQQGYETYQFPSLVVRHRVSTSARNLPRRIKQIFRNYMLMCLWYYPFPFSYLRALRFGPMQIMRSGQYRSYWKDVAIGYVQGWVCYFTWPHKKKRLNRSQFQIWKGLPASE